MRACVFFTAPSIARDYFPVWWFKLISVLFALYYYDSIQTKYLYIFSILHEQFSSLHKIYFYVNSDVIQQLISWFWFFSWFQFLLSIWCCFPKLNKLFTIHAKHKQSVSTNFKGEKNYSKTLLIFSSSSV